jgi:uncharacterized protein
MRPRLPLLLIAGGAAFAAGSWLAARSLARRLISAGGLAPAEARREDLLAALAAAGARVHDYRFVGAGRSPVDLAAIFATPGTPSARGTILFLHGKGGNAAEWEPDALRALAQGYNALVPDLRGHPPSRGDFVTYGFLEKDDLENAIAAGERFGLDRRRIAVHSCSAGSSIALAWAAEDPEVRGLWLESPFADAREMARHYLSIATGIPVWLLGLTTYLAVRRARETIRRALVLPVGSDEGTTDALASAGRLRAPVCLVYGERDRLVPPHFTRRLIDALPAGTIVWNPQGAGHCHHEDEPEKVLPEEYVARWTAFFSRAFAA